MSEGRLTPIMSDEMYKAFAQKVIPVPESGCWIWLGATDHEYGRCWLGNRKVSFRAHRASFVYHKGQIPEGMELDHLCRVKCCVNPDHLEVVTSRENTLRGVSITAQCARKTHCKKGHVFDADNTKRLPDGNRKCLKCYEQYRLNMKERRREAAARRAAQAIRAAKEAGEHG